MNTPLAEARLSAACDLFDAAYAAWLAARADVLRSRVDDPEGAEQLRAERERAAEQALATTPAPHSLALFQKWELLEKVMTEEADSGQRTYPLAIVALASLKADILAIGLKPWPTEE